MEKIALKVVMVIAAEAAKGQTLLIFRSSIRTLLALAVVCLITNGCAYTTAELVKQKLDAPKAEVALFSHCSSYGCQKVQQVSFNNEEWQEISAIFTPMSQNALEERQRLPIAVALMEKIIGPKTGTSDDIAKSWFLTFMPGGQLDCIDESINTTTYLDLLTNGGFIKHHDIGTIAIRGTDLDFRMLHNTATLIEHDSGVSYAIDSWFRANGVKPDVVLLEDWLDGWGPKS